jgi:hypothetical protein
MHYGKDKQLALLYLPLFYSNNRKGIWGRIFAELMEIVTVYFMSRSFVAFFIEGCRVVDTL